MTRAKIPMTKRGHDKLAETLNHLKTTRREQISEYMGSALADGDLRESAAYDEARMQQSENESRIIELEDQLERAQIIEENAQNGVGLGAKIKVKDERGTERSFEIVGTYEVDVLKGRISDQSPIGQALNGCRPGDTVTVPLPKGSAKFTLLEVTYE
ncbi:transcription elongation factor GreA [Deinococcus detaillensis]|uniref:Transcription elongation factor GreA n=1 Tax=Deinococcus detaillensis TaxID=2592048 RepID=A0A553V144_9DEIO|nr:transcription elongation factor GreA [Deinococcus detaillensis]TSA86154.1 transcription elongation factor GreA [Deinococcus detaillensis]